MAGTEPTIGTAIAKNAAWSVLLRLMMRCIGLISTLILVRILIPEDFGLVTMAIIVIGLAEALSDCGFDAVLINDKTAPREKYDTVWTIKIIRGLLIGVILWASAGLIADFFQEERLEFLLQILVLSPLLQGFTNIGIVDWRKDMKLHLDVGLRITEKLCAFVVTLIAALTLQNYWALACGILAGKVWFVGYSFARCAYRPRLSLLYLRDVMGFGIWMLGQGVLFYIRNRIDVILIGRLLDAKMLGLYSLAHEISNLITTELISPIRRALLPGYAKVVDDPEHLRTIFCRTLGITAILGLPLSLGLMAQADPLVRLLFGELWLTAIPLIQVLSFYGILNLLTSSTMVVFVVKERPQSLLVLNAAYLLILVPGLIYGLSEYGIIAAAWMLVIAQLIVGSAEFILAMRLIEQSLYGIFRNLWRPILSGIAMYVAVVEAAGAMPTGSLELMVPVLVGMGVYPLSLLTLWMLSGSPDGAERIVFTFLHNRLRKHLPMRKKPALK